MMTTLLQSGFSSRMKNQQHPLTFRNPRFQKINLINQINPNVWKIKTFCMTTGS